MLEIVAQIEARAFPNRRLKKGHDEKIFKRMSKPFDDEERALMEAFENGDVEIIEEGSNTDAVLDSAMNAIKEKQRKMYSFRLPISVMDRIKKKAQKAGDFAVFLAYCNIFIDYNNSKCYIVI